MLREGEAEDFIAQKCFLLGVLAEPRTPWRKSGMTIRKEKTVPRLEGNVYFRSWWKEEK